MDELTHNAPATAYDESNIRTIEGLEHVRLRPGMYIGKLGDGSHADDGIYVLLKEVIDNSIDEYRTGVGRSIDVRLDGGTVEVRDYGRGIPLGKMIEAVSVMNTGGKFDTKAFKKSVGLNGVGTKAVNALSSSFTVQAFRDGQTRRATYERGRLVADTGTVPGPPDEKTGTRIGRKAPRRPRRAGQARRTTSPLTGNRPHEARIRYCRHRRRTRRL